MTHAIHIRHLPFGRAALLDLDKPLVVHAHSRQHLLVHLGGAACEFGVGGGLMPLSAEHAVFVDSWQPHWYPRAAGQSSARILALYLDADWFAAHACRPVGNSLRLNDGAVQAVRLFVGELQEHDDGRAGVLACALLQFLEALRPVVASPASVAAPCAITPPDRRVQKAMQYMRANVGQRLEFSRIASDAGLSRPHFFELFHRDLGLTPKVYWNALRMEAAITQLADPRLSVAAVSANLGFSAQSNFTRFFRDIQGVAPGDYRAARIQTLS